MIRKKINLKKIFFFFFSLSLILVFSGAVLAAPPEEADLGKLPNPLKNTDSLPKLFAAIADTFIMLGTIVAALAIMYGGFLYVSAQGDEEKLKKAKTCVTWALVGTAVLLGSKVIAEAIKETISQIK